MTLARGVREILVETISRSHFFDHRQESLKRPRLVPFEKFAARVEKNWDGIAAYCLSEEKVSLGFVEKLDTQIQVIPPRAMFRS